MTTIAILGGGNGGFAAAAHLQSLGHTPQLYNRSEETIAAIQEAGGVEYSGAAGDGFASVPVITTDLEEALDGAEFIMVCLPAIAFSGLATQLAPHLDGSRPILLNPGSTGGSLAFRETLRDAGCDSVPPIGETNTLTYICRKRGDDHIHISSVVENVRFASVPAAERDAFEDVLEDAYPSPTPVENVLHTALSNVNAVLHPPGILLSAAWIEHTDGDFRFYYDAGTPAVANVMSDLDEERRAIADAWGLDVEPFPELFADIGSTSKEAGESGSFLRMLRESEPNKEIKAPSSVDHRFFNEDIPFGLVPMQTLARIADVQTPTIDSLITIASSITQSEYRADGWTIDRLGLPDDMAAVEEEL
ncbi:NAD/NADP-dependent octopine/nopaline dehydrogenase family protein [Natrarchaeobius chitinivorans]|uniref:NAD/NADP octopine/nopaline dehydrogenase n=1 Tax=Natrarchaeobius chitinivorans TaxID=1679083 RepID=A0A3N6PD54_NATCH|nr:NAD/NADP octopine/nopaline dehydrogenase family protein [Natrarchaeobius chitinivorans]RQG94855.1 NAD/NADP octopine/nopaline dehydrogenase [Natrarchaeobius chitinivorans]